MSKRYPIYLSGEEICTIQEALNDSWEYARASAAEYGDDEDFSEDRQPHVDTMNDIEALAKRLPGGSAAEMLLALEEAEVNDRFTKLREAVKPVLEMVGEYEYYLAEDPDAETAIERISDITSPVYNLIKPQCGHSACRQNWCDTGESICVEDLEEL